MSDDDELTPLQRKRLDRLAERLGELPPHRQRQLMDELEGKTVFTVEEAANICDVHPETVRRWIRADKLKAAKIGTEYRISRAELEEAWRNMGGGRLFPDETRENDER